MTTTVVPPAAVPCSGSTASTTVRLGPYVKRSAGVVVLVPNGVVTVMWKEPPDEAGLRTKMRRGKTTKRDAGVVPNLTLVAALKSLPKVPTRVAPAVGPVVRVRPQITRGPTRG